METITEIKARHTHELAQAELVQQAGDILRARIPNIKRIHPHCAHADVAVELSAANLPEAIETVERLNPLPVVLSRAGGTAIIPAPVADGDSIGPYWYRLSGIRQAPESKTVHCYIAVEGLTCRIDISVQDDPDTCRIYATRHIPGGVRIENMQLVNESGFFNKYLRFWSPDDQPADYICYEG